MSKGKEGGLTITRLKASSGKIVFECSLNLRSARNELTRHQLYQKSVLNMPNREQET